MIMKMMDAKKNNSTKAAMLMSTSTTPDDETPRTLNSSVVGWSTIRKRETAEFSASTDKASLLTGGSKVDQYLASRNLQKQRRQQQALGIHGTPAHPIRSSGVLNNTGYRLTSGDELPGEDQ